MKKLILSLIIIIVFNSCKKDTTCFTCSLQDIRGNKVQSQSYCGEQEESSVNFIDESGNTLTKIKCK